MRLTRLPQRVSHWLAPWAASFPCPQGQHFRIFFGLARTWKLADGTALRQLARHTPKSCYRRVASYNPDRRRQDYWVFRRSASVRHLGDVTILLSKRRRNDGPKPIKRIVTNLKETKTGDLLSYQARRWGLETYHPYYADYHTCELVA
jgi:hypothetical protein